MAKKSKKKNSEPEIEQESGDLIFGAAPNIEGEELELELEQQNNPIIDLIRNEIIEKQQDLLKNAVDKSMSRDDFREFATSDMGRELIAKLMEDKSLKKNLEEIELAGYQKLDEQFRDSFRPIKWSETDKGDRTSEILNSKGEKACSISERTVSGKPQNITMEDGSKVTINSYREVEFPKELEAGTGPLNFSMAVKDANGKNIPKDKAVYFTAHYDKEGKLQEMSSPVPVKFAGKGDDAMGYIERDGQIYTLPVNQGQYNAMAQEVAKNQGVALNLSQNIELADPSIDQFVEKDKTVKELQTEKQSANQSASPDGPQNQKNSQEAIEKNQKDKTVKELQTEKQSANQSASPNGPQNQKNGQEAIVKNQKEEKTQEKRDPKALGAKKREDRKTVKLDREKDKKQSKIDKVKAQVLKMRQRLTGKANSNTRSTHTSTPINKSKQSSKDRGR